MGLFGGRDMKTNGTEDPEIKNTQLQSSIFDNGVKSIHWRTYSLFIKWCWEK
jgi:hypothetical protein